MTDVAGWHRAIDLQLTLRRFALTEGALRLLNTNITDDAPERDREVLLSQMTADFLEACDGPAYFFEPEMVDVFAAAGNTLGSWTLRTYDFDYPAAVSGVALFAKPVGAEDGVARGMAWGQREGSSYVHYWLLFDPTDIDWSEVFDVMPPLVPQFAGVMFFDEEQSFEPGTVKGMLATFLAMIRQKIVLPHRERLPRAFARRAERFKVEPMVSIVTLRRPFARRSDEDEESQPVDWSHRWIVGAHWRAQWYPSEQRNRPIWISPYVKGPEDKPLVLKRRAFVVKR